MANKITGFKVNGTPYDVDLTKAGKVMSNDGSEYTIKVDDKGNPYTYKGSDDPHAITVDPLTPPSSTEPISSLVNTQTYKLYINSLYCGGKDDPDRGIFINEHTLNPCNYNFVELANLTGQDINLEGMSLQYGEESIGWYVLPLKGVIKNGSTFLIRGAKCGVDDFAKINVDDYDIEWKIDSSGNYSEEGTPIQFSNTKAKFYLRFSNEKATVGQPWGATVEPIYIDLVGIGAGIDGFESKEYTPLSSNFMYKKYYAMDPVKQATKDLSARKNDTLWNYVDLTKDNGEVVPNIEAYTPRASSYGKTIFSDKTRIEKGKPAMINCSFGIQATDGGSSKRATRCFNWLSRGLHNEYVWVRTKGSTSWGEAHESFKNETGVRRFYNRKTKEFADGRVVTAHRYILKGLTAGTYEYTAGHMDENGNPDTNLCTKVREFTVRTDASLSDGFTFVQTSDQQGFNYDEYQVWYSANRCMMKEYGDVAQFMINTGDIGQNGNRANEWLDYFDAKCDSLNNLEEMAAVGNNDLSPKDICLLGDGEDGCKLSFENYEFYFFAEMDENNPPVFTVNSVEYFIPSLYSFNYGNVHFLCMNTEIKTEAEHTGAVSKPIYESVYGFDHSGYFYPMIKVWCENDMSINAGKNWNIVYCHEMPFTILTTGVTFSPTTSTLTPRGNGGKGCHANDNTIESEKFWFSEFCQTHNVRLMIGGHKHTQSTSWPMMENVTYNNGVRSVDSWHTKIVISDVSELANFKINDTTPTSLVEYNDNGVIRKYPNTWISGGQIVNAATGLCYFCEFIMKSDVPEGQCPVVYAMSQATSYKHTSNKELPSVNIPWLRYYYPTDKNATKPDNKQKFPFFTVWTVTNNKIEGRVRKSDGSFNASGTFDINIDGAYTKRGISASDRETPIKSVNGLGSSVAVTSDEIIEIIK